MLKLTFKKRALLRLSGLQNPHQLSMRSGVTYRAVLRFVNEPEAVENIDTTVLASLLLKGTEMPQKDILNLRIGELFEFLDDGK